MRGHLSYLSLHLLLLSKIVRAGPVRRLEARSRRLTPVTWMERRSDTPRCVVFI